MIVNNLYTRYIDAQEERANPNSVLIPCDREWSLNQLERILPHCTDEMIKAVHSYVNCGYRVYDGLMLEVIVLQKTSAIHCL